MMNEETLVTVKIRKKFRDLAKIYSETTGKTMYRLIEDAIEQKCTAPQKLSSKNG